MAGAGPLARFAVLLTALLVVQVSVMPYLTVFGHVADLLLVIAVTGGLVAGEETGTGLGCAAGLCTDLIVQTPFGMWMLVGTIVGFAAGTMSGRVIDGGRLLRSAVTGFGAVTGIGLFVAIASLFGLSYVTERPIVSIIAVIGFTSALLAPLAELAIRWGLGLRVRPLGNTP